MRVAPWAVMAGVRAGGAASRWPARAHARGAAAPLAAALFATALAAPGCGGAGPPPESASASTAADASATAAAEAEPALALSSVPAPADVVAIGTLRSPSRLLHTAIGWSELSLDWRALLEAMPLGAIAPVIDFDAPIDAVVTLDPDARSRPRFFGAVSVGLTSRQMALDAFRSLDRPVELVEPGVHAVSPDARRTCFVSAALGQAPARLICASDRESLDRLAPYLARGNPSASTGKADLHVEVRTEPAYRVFGGKAQLLKLAVPTLMGEISLGDPALDGALEDALSAVVDDSILALEDLKGLTLEAVARDAERTLDVTVSLDFRSGRSWLPRYAADAAPRAKPAPEVFWHLPSDAHLATYQTVSGPALHAGMLQSLSRVAEAGLAYLGTASGSRRALSDLLADLWGQTGPIVSAHGAEPETGASAAGAGGAAADDPVEQLRLSLGYTLVGLDIPFDRLEARLEQLTQLYADAGLRRELGRRGGLDLSRLPAVRKHAGSPPLGKSRVYELAIPTDPSDLSAEAAPSPAASLTVFVVAARDGDRSWLGVSPDRKALEQRVARAISGSREGSLLERRDLEPLQREPGVAGGYWTPVGLARQLAFSEPSLAAALSRAGSTPVTWRSHAAADGPRLLFDVHVPAALVRDAAALSSALR